MKKLDFSIDVKDENQFAIGRLHFHIMNGAEIPNHISKNKEIANSNSCYLLVIPLHSPLGFNQNGRKGTVCPGEYVLLSPDNFLTVTADATSQFIWMYLPSTELRMRLVSIDDHLGRRFCANQEMSSLLVNFICDITKIYSNTLPSNGEALATQIINLVTLTISSEDRGTSSNISNGRYQLRKRIFESIEREVTNPYLTPKKIAASNRVSLSYLYSLFNDSNTTVGQFIIEKRLQKAFELLAQDLHGHMTVSEIAYQVGFKNVSHFSRTFSRHFNMAPRDVRRGKHCTKKPAQRSSLINAPMANLTGIFA